VDQERIKDDWMRYWLTILPRRYGALERFNHGFPLTLHRPGERLLEIGAGLGEHASWEPLEAIDYHALELRPEIAEALRRRHPGIKVATGDCQRRIPHDDATFDRVIAVHVLEHLPDLPAALAEIHRVLKPGGRLVSVIPCEGGLAYGFARQISSRRIFEKRYGMSYDFCIQSEHVNRPQEILDEMASLFALRRQSFFPLMVPFVNMNLVIGLVHSPRGASETQGAAQDSGGGCEQP
jgi:SAM-dependent methyltransferase